jgi:hypothetical protein
MFEHGCSQARNTTYTWIQKCGYYSNMIAFEEAIHLTLSGKRLPEPDRRRVETATPDCSK